MIDDLQRSQQQLTSGERNHLVASNSHISIQKRLSPRMGPFQSKETTPNQKQPARKTPLAVAGKSQATKHMIKEQIVVKEGDREEELCVSAFSN